VLASEEPGKQANTDSILMPTPQGDVKIVRNAQGISLEMPEGEINGKIRVAAISGPGAPPRLHVESSGTTMKVFAEMLSVGVVDRPVVDVTGLTGSYEVAVDLSQEDAMNIARASLIFAPVAGRGGDAPRQEGVGDRGWLPNAGASDPSGSSIISSIEKLGLKLEPRKLPLDLLVIDHIEKTPTAN
jgi:uncharacterized protein (TIGR03435 family)